MTTQYQLLALDVDGTLADANSRVTGEVVAAVNRAAAAGLRIVLATGRSHVETIDVWRQLELPEPHEPMVLIGGAIVSEPAAGRTLWHKPVGPDLAAEYAAALLDEGYSAAVILDVWRTGLDYLLVDGADIERVWERWFGKMDVVIRRVGAPAELGEHAALRINAVVDPEEAPVLEAKLIERFGDRLNIHAIYAPNYDVTVVEAFARGASKWTALRYIAQGYRIGPGRIVAVGDDVNDLPMIRNAGLGVAMPGATPAVRSAADALAEPSLPAFIDGLLAGKCDG